MISKNYISMLLLSIAVITFIKTTPFVVDYIKLCTDLYSYRELLNYKWMLIFLKQRNNHRFNYVNPLKELYKHKAENSTDRTEA